MYSTVLEKEANVVRDGEPCQPRKHHDTGKKSKIEKKERRDELNA